MIFFNQSISEERAKRGLIIVEAYFGLADHIYHIDAGVLVYKFPENVKEYNECQVMPVTKQL